MSNELQRTQTNPQSISLPMNIDGEKEGRNRIQSLRENQSLPMLTRRRMIKTELMNLQKIYEVQGKRSLETELVRQKALGEIEAKAIASQKIHLFKQIQARYGEMMATLGQAVEKEKLEHNAHFAEQLTKFERSLNGRDIAPRFLAQIQSQIDDAWNRYLDQLSEVFADVPSSR